MGQRQLSHEQDKGGSVLRMETTLARVKDLEVLRPRRDEPDGEPAWQPLRKGVHRRTKGSQAASERYLEALSVVDDSPPLPPCSIPSQSR